MFYVLESDKSFAEVIFDLEPVVQRLGFFVEEFTDALGGPDGALEVAVEIGDYVNVYVIDSMLEQFDACVYEDIGEIADCDFYNVSKEAKEELQELIQQWAEKHVKLPYWKVQNVVKKVVTQEDLE